MIGDVIRFRLAGHHLFALLEGRANDKRVSIFLQSREKLAANLKGRGSVRGTFLYVIERQGDSADAFEGDGHIRQGNAFVTNGTNRKNDW